MPEAVQDEGFQQEGGVLGHLVWVVLTDVVHLDGYDADLETKQSMECA